MKTGKHTGKICAAMAAAMLLATAPTAEAGVNWGEIAGGILGGIIAGQKGSGGGSSGGSNDGAILGGLSNQAHARKNMTNNEKLFVLAVKNNDYTTAQAMLDAGVDINGVYSSINSHRGGTVLEEVLGNSRSEMRQFLLEHGADPAGYYDYFNKFHSYLCIAAESYSGVFLVKYLHEWGAPLNDRRYPELLLDAIYNKSEENQLPIVEYLLANGIYTEYRHQYNDGRTPYLQAIFHSRPRIAALLAAYGADISARDAKGRDASRIALDHSDLDLYKAVQEINARGQQPSHYQPPQQQRQAQQQSAAQQAAPSDSTDGELINFESR